MAIVSDYRDGMVRLKDAYIKVDRIWGSKQEGWNCWVGVYAQEGDLKPAVVFSVNAPYVENQNPFVALYEKIAALPTISADSEKVAEVEQSEPPKKTRRTKKKV